ACASASVSATWALPSSSYHAGMRWPHQSWRETHQGWIFSSQLNQVFDQVSGTILISPALVAAIARSASGATFTYHWSVSQGSITTPARSPLGVAMVRHTLFCRA